MSAVLRDIRAAATRAGWPSAPVDAMWPAVPRTDMCVLWLVLDPVGHSRGCALGESLLYASPLAGALRLSHSSSILIAVTCGGERSLWWLVLAPNKYCWDVGTGGAVAGHEHFLGTVPGTGRGRFLCPVVLP